MKVGILCAGDEELAPFLPLIKDCRVTKKAMLEFYEGQIQGIPVVALFSGVCKVNAAIAAQLLADSFAVSMVINAGTAGGMDPRVQLFDTIIGEKMLYHDVAEDILTEFHPWLREPWFCGDPKLLAAARAYAAHSSDPIRFGTIATGEAFIKDGERERILQKYRPLSVDMETASVAHVCYVNRIPFLSVRTITDTAAHNGLKHFEQNCAAASQQAAKITVGIVKQLLIQSR